ncbi:MAG: glycosyltransferase family 4 protein [Flavobacteriales bacterium]|nr:glycosyltransferase family 4 protein [Flavobacteriales bacterium]
MKLAKILFLHSELAKYFIASLKELSKKAEVHVVHWPINSEAPFKFDKDREINYYPKHEFTSEQLLALCQDISPDMVIVSGWRDKEYMSIIKELVQVPVRVMSLDNPWAGKVKQRIWSALSRKSLLPFFTHCWVAGERQRTYARKLGFKENRILDKLYSADSELFERVNQIRVSKTTKERAKRFVYIGRYSEEKGIDILFDAFLDYSKKPENDWELWCLGTGPLFDQKPEHERIKHFGFVQPEDMPKILEEVDAFVLPSIFEPWGLVAHEMAAAGLPMILTDKVGATEEFLVDGKNGFLVVPGSKNELRVAMEKITQLSEKEYVEMSKVSSELSKRQSPAIWADNVMELL